MPFQDIYKVVLRSSQVDQRRLQYAKFISWLLFPILLVFPFLNSYDYSGLIATGYIAVLGTILLMNLLIKSSHWLYALLSMGAAAAGLLYFVYLGYGNGGSLLWIYGFPLAVIFLTGMFWGSIASVFSGGAAYLIMTVGPAYGAYDYGGEFTARFIISYLVIAALASGFEFWRIATEMQKEAIHRTLNQTRHVLKKFTGVCAWCNSIRDVDGSWQTVESYVEKKESATVSHSICPDCESKQLAEAGSLQD